MKPWLLALLIAAAPPEDCDMAQKPILYPGTVVSRNSQVRQAALQGGAYAGPPPWTAEPPVTVPGYYVAQATYTLTGADRAWVMRLKRGTDEEATAVKWTGFFKNNSVATATLGIAVYEIRGSKDDGDTLNAGLFLIKESVVMRPVVAADFLKYNTSDTFGFDAPFLLERGKSYVMAFYSETTDVEILKATTPGNGARTFPMTAAEGFPARVRLSTTHRGSWPAIDSADTFVFFAGLQTAGTNVFIP